MPDKNDHDFTDNKKQKQDTGDANSWLNNFNDTLNSLLGQIGVDCNAASNSVSNTAEQISNAFGVNAGYQNIVNQNEVDFNLMSLFLGNKKKKINTKAYVYNGDKAVKDKNLEKLVKSKKHLFVHADANVAFTFGTEIKELVLEKSYEEAYAYLSNIRSAPRGDLFAAIAGIVKCAIHRKPHNDFYELAEGLALSNAAIAGIYEAQRAEIKKTHSEMYMRYMCIIAGHLFEYATNSHDEKWFVETFRRLFHYLEIILTLAPVAQYKNEKDFVSAYSKMYKLSPPITDKLKNLLTNDITEIKKIERLEKRLENYAKELKL